MTVAAAPLRALVADIFAAAGCGADEAERIARYLVTADLVGHPSHGVIRVPRYLDGMERGSVRPGRKIEILRDAPGFAVVDGGFGFGQTVGEQAVDLGIEKARAGGVSAVGLRRAAHLGRIADWPERAAAAGMASVHFVNASGVGALVAPFGGVDRRMSTNPFAVGVPNGDAPIVLDFATSVVAEGKVMVAVNGGKPLPDGALIDGDGALSSDPEALYGPIGDKTKASARGGRGAIRAMGDHKGSAGPAGWATSWATSCWERTRAPRLSMASPFPPAPSMAAPPGSWPRPSPGTGPWTAGGPSSGGGRQPASPRSRFFWAAQAWMMRSAIIAISAMEPPAITPWPKRALVRLS